MTGTRDRTLGLVALSLAALIGGAIAYGVPSDDPRGAAALGTQMSGTAAREAVSATILIDRGGISQGYATPRVTISQDGQLSVLNRDTYTHTVTSTATDADGEPLFDVVVPPGATRSIPAATGLGAGDYAFYCRFHPNMRGTLTVTGDSGGPSGEKQKFKLPLVVPKVVRDDHVRLDMHQAKVRMLPDGKETKAWTYGGTWPGPTIRRPAGHRTLVTVANDLPRKAGSMTMHLHGDHHASKYDGQPTSFLVRRGHARTYRYDLTESGRPEPGSFFFYHDHRMDRTTVNNWMGLQGMFIVDNPDEARVGLPSGRRDVPLMVSDRSFTKANQLAKPLQPMMTMHHGDMAFTGPHAPPNDANVGTRILVNGRFAPHLRTAAVRYRLRLLNTSAFSSYNFSLSDGRPFIQVGTGDGLLPEPVTRQTILLGPSQRADVIVDFHGEQGQNVVLQTVPRTDSDTGTGSREGDLMQFRVRRKAPDHSDVPAKLPSPELVRAPKKVSMTWTFSLEGNEDSGTFWAINGKAFDAARIDHRVKLGSRETWRLRNTSDVTHYVHIHEEQWRTVSRDGQAPPPWERGLEDTWKLDPGEEVVVAAKFTDYIGPFMIHCHMLDHEDHGMMATFKVVR
ncbi:MAG TPA: multicopper oxidase domain-containing protein [Nocardioides sp.]|nr:multicopper oxidase domain-containing protein [Nocardioides sp.]